MDTYYQTTSSGLGIFYYIAIGLAYFIGCMMAGHAAEQRGHGSALPILLSIFVTPFFGILYVIALPVKERHKSTSNSQPEDNLPMKGDTEKVAALKKLNNEFDKSSTMTFEEYNRRKHEIEQA